MKRFLCLLLAALCAFSFAACDNKKEENRDEDYSSSETDSEKDNNGEEARGPFIELLSNPTNMCVYADFALTFGKEEKEKKWDISVKGKIDGENGYAKTTVNLDKLPLFQGTLEGYYVDGTVYNVNLKEKKANAKWNDGWMSTLEIVEEYAPLHLLSKEVKEGNYQLKEVESGIIAEISVDSFEYEYSFLQLVIMIMQESEIRNVEKIFLNEVDFTLYLTSSGKLEYIQPMFSAQAITTEGIVNLDMEGKIILSDIGATVVTAPADADKYKNIT